jgi:hypothetical protein
MIFILHGECDFEFFSLRNASSRNGHTSCHSHETRRYLHRVACSRNIVHDALAGDDSQRFRLGRVVVDRVCDT